MSDGGKGSKPRPFSVSQEEYDNRWNTIFSKDIPAEHEEKVTRYNEETQNVLGIAKKEKEV
jgi:hypothetical protein